MQLICLRKFRAVHFYSTSKVGLIGLGSLQILYLNLREFEQVICEEHYETHLTE
jgi:hypothetical protein